MLSERIKIFGERWNLRAVFEWGVIVFELLL
jgi:hypothetical protein